MHAVFTEDNSGEVDLRDAVRDDEGGSVVAARAQLTLCAGALSPEAERQLAAELRVLEVRRPAKCTECSADARAWRGLDIQLGLDLGLGFGSEVRRCARPPPVAYADVARVRTIGLRLQDVVIVAAEVGRHPPARPVRPVAQVPEVQEEVSITHAEADRLDQHHADESNFGV
jgi:hypothetical protein